MASDDGRTEDDLQGLDQSGDNYDEWLALEDQRNREVPEVQVQRGQRQSQGWETEHAQIHDRGVHFLQRVSHEGQLAFARGVQENSKTVTWTFQIHWNLSKAQVLARYQGDLQEPLRIGVCAVGQRVATGWCWNAFAAC